MSGVGSVSPGPIELCEHARVIYQRLQVACHDSPELWMSRVEQPVMLTGGENRWHDQQTMLLPLSEFVAHPEKFRRRCRITPICGQLADLNLLPAQVIWYLGNAQNKVGRRVILTDVHEILQQGEGLMLRGIAEANTGARPASPITVGPFAIEGSAGILLTKDPIDRSQLIPP